MARRRSSRPAPGRTHRTSRSGRSSGGSGLWLFLLGLLVGAGGLYLVFRDTPETSGQQASATHATGEAGDAEEAADAAREGRLAPRQAGAAEARPQQDGPTGPDGPDGPDSNGQQPPEESAEPDGGGEQTLGEGEKLGRVALVIDDLGRSFDDLAPLRRLGVPVSYAVLPFEEETPAVVAELRRRGVEILLHLPMEPRNGEDPGPGALRLGMSDEELREQTLAALRAVPGAAGVNNHMGSGLSAHEPSMEAILGLLAARRLFFLDSRTSAESVGYRVAASLGIPAAERQVFLDDDQRPEAIRTQFQRLLGLARSRGAAIAIGHPHPATLAVLAAEVPRAREMGYEFVPVSFLLDRPDEEPE